MERTSTPRAEELFLAAIERSPGDRASFLTTACAGDGTLRAEVDILLACHDGAGEFLERSPAPAAYMPDDLDLTRLPERIGKFKIKRLLGAGGMGCVYLAESDEPRRDVALKVVRPGLGTTELLRRFRHEVQVVALLQHPGIAQLYEAGAESTPGGPLPYFAMEHVHGPSITGHARLHGLGWRDRMQLVARVAQAVQHAHQKGVIHRDLKPANILVDGLGQPKILDFGVARLMEPEAGGAGAGGVERTRTTPGQVVGTLSYMSPEQLSGDPTRVDARADIYALGVVLYELLAGAPPYDVASASLGDAVKTIEQTRPKRLGEIDAHLRGDPEIIVEKAMEKDPAARYQSAVELAGDIERCLTDQPIMARRPSAVYQLTKFARRNRTLAGSSALALMAIVVGLVAAIWQARAANAARAVAEDQLEIIDMLISAAPAGPKKADEAAQQVLSRSSVEAIRARYSDSPLMRMKFNGVIGRTYKSLAELPEAEPHLVEAAMIARMVLPPQSPDRLRALRDLGHLYKQQDRFAEGEEILREATETAAAAHGKDAEVTIECRNDLASLLLRKGASEEAARLFGESAETCLRALGEAHPLTLVSMNNWAAAMKASGKVKDCIEVRRRVLALCLAQKGEEDIGTMTSMNNLAKDYMDAGAPEEAEPLLKRALELRLRVHGPKHPSTLNTKCNLGSCLSALGRQDDACTTLAEVTAIADEQNPTGNLDTAKYDADYARVLAKLDRSEEARQRFLKAYRSIAAAQGAKSKQAAGVARELSELCAKMKMADEAAAWSERATTK